MTSYDKPYRKEMAQAEVLGKGLTLALFILYFGVVYMLCSCTIGQL